MAFTTVGVRGWLRGTERGRAEHGEAVAKVWKVDVRCRCGRRLDRVHREGRRYRGRPFVVVVSHKRAARPEPRGWVDPVDGGLGFEAERAALRCRCGARHVLRADRYAAAVRDAQRERRDLVLT